MNISIAERHNDVVLLQLTQSGGGVRGIEEIDGGHIGFGLDFRLKLNWRTCISEHDKHLELHGPGVGVGVGVELDGQ